MQCTSLHGTCQLQHGVQSQLHRPPSAGPQQQRPWGFGGSGHSACLLSASSRDPQAPCVHGEHSRAYPAAGKPLVNIGPGAGPLPGLAPLRESCHRGPKSRSRRGHNCRRQARRRRTASSQLDVTANRRCPHTGTSPTAHGVSCHSSLDDAVTPVYPSRVTGLYSVLQYHHSEAPVSTMQARPRTKDIASPHRTAPIRQVRENRVFRF